MSNGGAAFFAGKSINNKEPKEQASIAGAVAMALHVRQMSKFYGIPVVLHSDHCAKKLLPWFDGMLEADEVSCRVLSLGDAGESLRKRPFCYEYVGVRAALVPGSSSSSMDRRRQSSIGHTTQTGLLGWQLCPESTAPCDREITCTVR